MIFDEIKQAVKAHCNLSSDEADTRVGSAINRHYKRVTSLIGMDSSRFVTRTASTTASSDTVEFIEIEKIDRVRDVTAPTSIRLLDEVSLHKLRSSQPGAGQPELWALQSSSGANVTVLLDTAPTSVYSLQADGWATLADLTSNDAPAFPESFHDVLTWFVLAEELLRKEKDKLAAIYEVKAERVLSDLRFHLSDSPTKVTQQRQSRTGRDLSRGIE